MLLGACYWVPLSGLLLLRILKYRAGLEVWESDWNDAIRVREWRPFSIRWMYPVLLRELELSFPSWAWGSFFCLTVTAVLSSLIKDLVYFFLFLLVHWGGQMASIFLWIVYRSSRIQRTLGRGCPGLGGWLYPFRKTHLLTCMNETCAAFPGLSWYSCTAPLTADRWDCHLDIWCTKCQVSRWALYWLLYWLMYAWKVAGVLARPKGAEGLQMRIRLWSRINLRLKGGDRSSLADQG